MKKKRQHKVYTHYLYKQNEALNKDVERIIKKYKTKKYQTILRQRVEKEFRATPPIKDRNKLILKSIDLYSDTSFGKYGRFKRVRPVKSEITVTKKKGIVAKDKKGREYIKVIRVKKKVQGYIYLWYDRKTGKYLKGKKWTDTARKAYEKNIISNIAKDKKISFTDAKKFYNRNKKRRYIQLKNIYYNPY